MATVSRGEIAPFTPRARASYVSAPISKSRLAPPRIPPGLVGAERAHQWVESVLAHDLTLVSAPIAYGKTVFAARIFHEMREAGFHAAWVSCAGMAQGSMMAHLVEAISGAIETGAPLIQTDDSATTAVLIANRIYDHDGPVLLCLDEADCIAGACDTSLIDHLISNCPTNLHILLTARRRTEALDAWVTGRKSAQIIGQAALALVDADLADYLASENIALAEDAVHALNAGLAGWWGGAREAKARLAHERRLPAAHSWQDACAQWPVALFETALAALSEEERGFLSRCAITPEIDASLAALLTGLPEPAALATLRNLVRAGCLIEPVPGPAGAHRLHPAFRLFLLEALAERDPETMFEARGRAIAWHAAHARPIAVIEIALAGNDDDLLADMLVAHGEAALALAGPSLVREALSRISRSARATNRPGISELQALTEMVGAGGASGLRNDASDLARDMSVLAEAETSARAGDQLCAHRLLAPIMRRGKQMGFGYVEALAAVAIADCRRAQGHPADAERVVRDAMARLSDGIAMQSDTAIILSAALADCLYQQNDLAAVTVMLDDFAPFLANVADNGAVLRGYRVAIRMAVAQGHLDEAMNLIEQVEDLANDRDWLPLTALAAVERMRIHAPLITPLERIVAMADEESAITDLTSPAARAFALLSEARAFEAILDLDRPRLTMVADRVLRLADRLDHVELRVIGTLLHVLPQLSGRCDRMVEIGTANFLNHAAGIGFVRTMIDLLEFTGVRTSQDFNTADYSAGTFLSLLRLIPRPENEMKAVNCQRMATPAFSFLSPRELEIVAALSAGETNKIIARKLGLTPETIKWHMKSLMRKLRASTRDQVVSNARTLGIALPLPELSQ